METRCQSGQLWHSIPFSKSLVHSTDGTGSVNTGIFLYVCGSSVEMLDTRLFDVLLYVFFLLNFIEHLLLLILS